MFNHLQNIDVGAWIPLKLRIWALPLFFALFGVFLLWISLWVFRAEQDRSGKVVVTTGIVVQIEYSSRLSCPLIEFVDAAGMVRRFRGNICSKPPAFAKGESVKVAYVPSPYGNPRMAEGVEAIPYIPALFSFLFLAVAGLKTRSAILKLRALSDPKY